MDKRKQGTRGEDIACRYLIENGYEIILRNYYTRYGEIDIIARIKDVLVFVEVKMRSNAQYGTGAEAVTQKKIEKIRICAQIYTQEHKIINQELRFDVIGIMGTDIKKINHIIAAF